MTISAKSFSILTTGSRDVFLSFLHSPGLTMNLVKL